MGQTRWRNFNMNWRKVWLHDTNQNISLVYCQNMEYSIQGLRKDPVWVTCVSLSAWQRAFAWNIRLFLPSLPPAESRRHLLSTGGSAGRNRHLQATLLFVFYFKFHSKFYYKVAATGLTLLARTYTSIYFSMDLLRFSARESQGWMLLKTTSSTIKLSSNYLLTYYTCLFFFVSFLYFGKRINYTYQQYEHWCQYQHVQQ